jgi:glycosyltransferase involved in cell wall biosynthesis
MKILWIPHGTWQRKIRQRDHYLIDSLKDRHSIDVLTWSEPRGPGIKYLLDPAVHLSSFRDWTRKIGDLKVHHYKRLNPGRFGMVRKINERFFQKKVRELATNADVVICGPNHYLNGFPPFDLEIPIIFDYLDYMVERDTRDVYLKESAAVLCVSRSLLKDAKKYNKKSYYLPNGVDLDRFSEANPSKVVERYGLENKKVVSLIGLTADKSLYFLDAFPAIKERVPELKYLIVGEGHLLPYMKRRVEKYQKDIIFTGWVDYVDIPDYFAATDVGTYPANRNPYYDSASPIKVFEYTAAKKPVVAPSLSELVHLDFPNVVYCEPTPEDFADKVIYALSNTFEYPDLKDYDWGSLARKLEDILEGLL